MAENALFVKLSVGAVVLTRERGVFHRRLQTISGRGQEIVR